MKYLLIVLISVFFSCKNETPEPEVMPDVKEMKEATLDDFIGEWVYLLEGKPYKKIIIEKNGVEYDFKHYVIVAGDWNMDVDVYYPQNLDQSKFVNYKESSLFFPYINVNSSFSSGTAILTYKVSSSKKLLELGISKYNRVE